MNDDITNQGPSLYDWSVADEAVSNVGAHALSDREDRIKRLEEAKARKLGLQSKVNNFASFTDTFTDLGDGILESNANKLWNDLNAQDIQSVQSAGIQKYALTPDEQGVMRFANGEAYTGKTRRLYGFGTQDHSNEEFKYGLASGKYKGSEQRYTPNAKYELNLGPQGVDIQDKQQDIILPDNVATVLEGLAHGRREALRARAVQDIFEDPDAYNAYGSGASEYYTSKEGLFGTPQEINYGRGLELLQRYMNQVSSGAKASQQKFITREERLAQIKQENQGIAADNYSLVDRYGNTLAGFASAFTNSLLISPAQAIGDLTGLYDISGADKDVESLFGYNPVVAERAMQEMGEQWKVIVDSNASTADRMKAAGNAMLTSFLTPEMYGTSMGTLMSWMAPTALLKVVGVGSKFAKAAQAIDKLQKAGKLSTAGAKVAKAKTLLSVEGMPELLARQSGHVISAFGEVNNQYNDWVKNNNGIELEGADKAGWFAARFGVQLINQNLDKLVDFDLVTKNPGLITAAIPAIKNMTNREFAAATKAMAKGLGTTAVNMGSEAAQEYAQTMMELANARYGSEKFKDVEEFTAFLTDPRNTTEAGVAALAGAGGAPQFEVGGAIGRAPFSGLSSLNKSIQTSREKRQANMPKTSLEGGTPSSEDEIKTAKKRYADSLNRLRKDVAEGKVTAENIGIYLDEIDEINRTKHIISTSPEEQIQAGEDAYNKALDQLEAFIRENPDIRLNKRITRKTVQESVQEKKDRDDFGSLSEDIKQAFQSFDSVGRDSTRSVGEAIRAVTQEIKGAETLEDLTDDSNIMVPELQQLEKALRGTISEDAASSFTNVKEYLTTNDLRTKNNITSVPTDTNTNNMSEKTAETTLDITETPTMTTIEEEYNDYSRAADAERTVTTLLGSGRTYDPEFVEKVFKYARNQGVSEQRLNNIIKSFELVKEEATVGKRGYVTRLARLRGLVESSDRRDKDIHDELQAVISMQSSIARSADQLQRGVQKAKEMAEERNKAKFWGKNKLVTTEYNQLDGTKHTIWVSKENGKWVARTDYTEKLIKEKRKYIDDINNEIRELGIRANTVKPGSMPVFGTLTIPAAEGARKDVQYGRAKDTKLVSKVGEILKNLGLSSFITGAIIDENHTKKWTPKGDYHRANAALINKQEFDADDVVLINANAVVKNRQGKVVKNKLMTGSKVPFEKLTDAQKSFRRALEAGASIVLDSDLDDNARIALTTYLKRKNYELLDGYNGAIFIKPTPETTALIQEQKVKLAEKKKEKEAKKKDKDNLIAFTTAITYGVDPITGEEASPELLKELKKKRAVLAQQVAKDSFKGDFNNLKNFIIREMVEQTVKAANDFLAAGDKATPLDFPNNRGLEVAARKYIEKEMARTKRSEEVLAEWKKAAEAQLQGKKREAFLTKLLETIGAVPRALGASIKEKSFALGKNDIFEEVYMAAGTGKEVIKTARTALSKEDIEKYSTNGRVFITVVNGKEVRTKHILLDIRRVSQDPFKFLQLSRTTVLNSLPVEKLPPALRSNVKDFMAKVFKALRVVEPGELAAQTDAKKEGTNKFLDGSFNLYNSPARGFIFNKDGKPNEQVLAAMYVALGDMFTSDLSKLLRGYKTDADLALLFNVQEHEVTREMQEHAKEHGALLKTVADSLGKAIVQQMGFSEQTKDVGAGEYKAFISDLGNSAIAIAEKLGLIELTYEESDVLAKLFTDGKPLDTAARTYFVNIPDKNEVVGKYTRKQPADIITKFLEQFKGVVKEFPESSTLRKGYFLNAPTEEQINQATSKVHNDIFGKQVPKAGKETIRHLMNTGYEVNLDRINEFLSAIDASDSQVKKHLGYVEIDEENPDYIKLSARDKAVQPAKNRALEKTIQELRTLKEVMEKAEADGKPIKQIFFNYFYASNDRYMMDSNTINPQVDKIVRFLVVPAAHRLEYTIKTNDVEQLKTIQKGDITKKDGTPYAKSTAQKLAKQQGEGWKAVEVEGGWVAREVRETTNGLLFEVNGVDQSFLVRLAIAQGFGQSVDKMHQDDVIAYSDAMLSMTEEQLDKTKKALLEKNKHEIQVQGSNKKYEIEADHITHALQTIDFLKQALQARENGTSFTSALSLEFDSLTSGFANKIQQMPILDNMTEHYARTGVLTQEFIQQLKELWDWDFDLSKGDTVATVLAKSKEIGFYDSYQSMANKTTEILAGGKPQRENLSTSVGGKGVSGLEVYEIVKSLLPGSDVVKEKQEHAEGTDKKFNITKNLRNLFKPPFMIFNYSAGIKRIVKNLGFEISDSLVEQIVAADFTKDTEVEAVVKNLLAKVDLLYPKANKTDKDKKISTPKELQAVLRTHVAAKVLLATPFPVTSVTKRPKNYKNPNNLEALLSEVATQTYGQAVQDVFEKEFEKFIAVQDAMNDTYKIAFRIFDHKRMELLKKISLEKEDHVLTAQDHAQVLEELWDDFPWIVGPLTGSKDKDSVKKDVITIASTSVRSPKSIEQARVKPQTVLGVGSKTKTRTISPLIRYMEEAVSSGSVLPFHAIDGAEIGYLVNEMFLMFRGKTGIAVIHDAMLSPLNQAEHAIFLYNQGMHKINSEMFNLAAEMVSLVQRMEKTINDEHFDKEYKEVSVKGIKSAQTDKQGKITDTFPQLAKLVVGNMKVRAREIQMMRDKYYGENGSLKDALYGNMVGIGMYKPGDIEPDLSYKERFKSKYQTVTINDEIIEEDDADKIKAEARTESQQEAAAQAEALAKAKKDC